MLIIKAHSDGRRKVVLADNNVTNKKNLEESGFVDLMKMFAFAARDLAEPI